MEILLEGCNPTPLAAYLKALGILRLVAEQVDDKAKGYWRNNNFVLQSALDRQALTAFFMDTYQPTPIIAPWNGGSGFYYQESKTKEKDPITGKKKKTGRREQPTTATKTVDQILISKSIRFKEYRETIKLAKELLNTFSLDKAPEDTQKNTFISAMRSSLPDSAVAWLDAFLILTEIDGKSRTKYPPLLGTGGNDGNLDFTNNYMQRLLELFNPVTGQPHADTTNHVESALFGIPAPGLKSAAIGQFSPGVAGGPNATTGFNADSLINPWDFILMLEGAVLFAAASTRRMESADPGVLSYPFTVRSTGSGAGNTAFGDEANARAEIWLPLWGMPTSLEEIKNLLSEGRATLDRKPAKDGLDFVRAVSRLGVERGIDAFQRYAFVMRSGKAYLATPLARVSVNSNPSARLIDELDRNNWLYRFRQLARSKEAPARIQGLVRQMEDILFDLARHSEPQYVQKTLILLGQAQLYLRESPNSRERCGPVPILSREWAIKADDGGPEYQLARALAGLHAKTSVNGILHRTMFMAGHFAPLNETPNFRKWDEESHHRVVWGRNALEYNLYAVLRRRLMDGEKSNLSDKPLASDAFAPLSAIAAWFDGTVDPGRVAALLPGLILIRIPFVMDDGMHEHLLPAAYALLKPLFCTNEQLHKSDLLPDDRNLPLPVDLISTLRQNPNKALAMATNRLRAAGCPLRTGHINAEGIDAQHLLTALMVPISNRALKHLISPLRIKQSTEPEMTS